MFTELYVAAFDEKALSMDESISNFSAGAVVNPRDGRAGHVHLAAHCSCVSPSKSIRRMTSYSSMRMMMTSASAAQRTGRTRQL